MYKLAADRRPRPVKTKMTFAQNQTEADDIYKSFKPVRINYTYFNYSGGDITIIDRSGMKFTIRPLSSGGTRYGAGIIVVKNYTFHDTVIIDEITLSSEMSHEEVMLRKAFASRRRISPNETSVDVIYSLSPEAFREFNECVYIRELDIVITKGNDRVVHPYSDSGVALSGEADSMDGFTGLGFRWISHDYQKQTLYLNLSGMVMTVTSIHDLQMEEGFYVYAKGLEQEVATRLIRMPLTEAVEKYGLTSSLYEAQNALSVEERLAKDVDYIKSQQKLELMNIEHGNKMAQSHASEKSILAKIEEIERKREADRESSENDSKEREIAHQQFLQKLQTEMEKTRTDMQMLQYKLQREEESNRRDDYWEERSYQRKDTSEFVKWLPGIAVGLGLLLPKLMS